MLHFIIFLHFEYSKKEVIILWYFCVKVNI